MKSKKEINKESIRWKKYFKSMGLPPILIERYLCYIEKLLNKELPIIFEFSHLAKLLGRTEWYLASVINCSQKHYRIFRIPKRRGNHREIDAPYPALLECQQWIYENILKKIKLQSSVHGFVPNKSILTNAKPHVNSDSVLKLDIKDFFPSIKINRIIYIFQSLGYPHNISFYLASICCFKKRLPQGAATSPYLSNIVLKSFDKKIYEISKEMNFIYTRYADDITISGNEISAKLKFYIEHLIKEAGFKVNYHKTRVLDKKRKKVITGIVVRDGQMFVPRKFKRDLRKEIHFILKYGLISHMSKLKIRNPFYLDSVYGKLLFWHNVEPNNEYALDNLTRVKDIKTNIALHESV